LREAIRLKPEYTEAYNELGYTYHKLARYNEAIEEYKKAIRLKPDYTLAHYNLGLSYLATGNRTGATGQYRILQRLDQNQASKLYSQMQPSLRN